MDAFVRGHAKQIAPRELEVYYKLYIEGRSKSEAASVLGITNNTFRTLLRRLRLRLRPS